MTSEVSVTHDDGYGPSTGMSNSNLRNLEAGDALEHLCRQFLGACVAVGFSEGSVGRVMARVGFEYQEE